MWRKPRVPRQQPALEDTSTAPFGRWAGTRENPAPGPIRYAICTWCGALVYSGLKTEHEQKCTVSVPLPLIPLPITVAQKIGFHPLVLPVEDLVETLRAEFDDADRDSMYDPEFYAGVQVGIRFVVNRFFPQTPKVVPEDDGG